MNLNILPHKIFKNQEMTNLHYYKHVGDLKTLVSFGVALISKHS